MSFSSEEELFFSESGMVKSEEREENEDSFHEVVEVQKLRRIPAGAGKKESRIGLSNWSEIDSSRMVLADARKGFKAS